MNERTLRGMPRNKTEEIILKKKILPYFAMKIKANKPDPYSILNPETSSDSPSEKSNGVRLVSASQETNRKRQLKGRTIIRGNNLENLIISSNLSKLAYKRNVKRIRAKLISYEIVGVTPRREPSMAYLLLEAHPERRRGKLQARIITIITELYFTDKEPDINGTSIQTIDTNIRPIMGESK